MNDPYIEITDRWIITNRGKKNDVNPQRPYAWLVEKERTAAGRIEDVAIIFLTNRECPFHCLMCDLWKNTTDETVPSGAIPDQIEWALKQLPSAKHIKLYNSGNFFDHRAIPVEDYEKIAFLVRNFETIIVESHPRLINEKCLYFNDMLKSELQIAMGLETIHPEILPKLNKQMDPGDFQNAVGFLNKHGISVRAFILLRPPFLTESEGVFWAERSIDFAFGVGATCCTVIPVRSGNGAMDLLFKSGFFSPPDIRSLEKVLEYGIGLHSGRVFADVWDIDLFSSCKKCLDQRTNRLIEMNLSQKILEPVVCDCDTIIKPQI
jgi:radical SAM enzyme (TIGR01210 family)